MEHLISIFMKVTKELLMKLYDQYNETYYGGVLGKCEFSLIPKTIGGLGRYQNWVDSRGKERDRISIGTIAVWNETLLRDVLVHEMAHMYVRRIDGRKHDGLMGHGRYFRRQVRRIKQEFGFDIDDRFKKVEYVHPKYERKRWDMILAWIIDR